MIALDGTPFARSANLLSGHADGFNGEAWTMAWTLLAAQRTGAVLSATTLASALARRAQTTGCFTVADTESSVELTALVARSLRAFASADAQVSFARNAALTCLQSLQQPGGGFGSPHATAAAAIAFSEADATFASSLSAARAFVVASQHSDGSWGTVRATALALQALGGAPDWQMPVQHLTRRALFRLSQMQVSQGATVTAFIDVRNASNNTAPAAPLQVRAVPLGGGPTLALADLNVPSLAPGQVVTVSAQLPTSALSGRYQLEAEVDPLRVLLELDRTNNVATAVLNVVVAFDVSITTASISFTPGGAGSVSVSVRVTNEGATTPAPTSVEVYKSSLTGPLLGTFTVPAGLAYAHSFTGTVTMSTSSSSGFTPIWATVDPANTLFESDEQNNTAVRFYENGAERAVDLQVVSSDFSIQGPAVADRPLTVAGQVRNLSANDATRVQVALVDPFGTTLGFVDLPLVPAGGSTPVSFTLTLAKSQQARVIADVGAALNDTNRNNNSALVTLNVTTATNLVVTALSPTAPLAQDGAPVSFSAAIRNDGPQLSSTTLRLTEEREGAVASVLPVQLAAGEVRIVTLGPFITPSGASSWRACLDPFGTVDESNENDNCREVSIGAQSTALRLESSDVSISPVGVDVGQKFIATAVVHNTSNVAAEATLEWWQGAPGFPYGTRVAEQRVHVAAATDATFSRDFVRDDGTPEVHARLTRITPRNLATAVVQGGRHLFLEQAITFPNSDTLGGPFTLGIRVGRLTGRTAPELVLGLERNAVAEPFATVVTYERGPSSYVQLWSRDLTGRMADLALVDLDRNGTGEVVVLTGAHQIATGVHERRVWVLDHNGAIRWSTQLAALASVGDHYFSIALADHDGDGVTDVAAAAGLRIFRVFSGVDGHVLLDVNLAAQSIQEDARITALDVTGDGTVEYLVFGTGAGTGAALYSHAGVQLWQSNRASQGSGVVADLSTGGQPQYFFPANATGTDLIDVASNNVVASAPTAQAVNGNFNLIATVAQMTVGALRQDGLPYTVFAPTNQGRLRAWRGDFDLRWDVGLRATSINTADVDWGGTLADMYGLGRPQVIGSSCQQPLIILDGRTGQPLIGHPDPNDPCSASGINAGNQLQQPPVVADLTGQGAGGTGVVVGYSPRATPLASTGGGPFYGRAQALIFKSPSWGQKLPPTWATRAIVKGQVGDDLKLTGGAASHRWWTTHNTWNQQFDLEPSRLLPDLTTTIVRQGPATANQTFAVVATLNNVGGLTASNVPVTLYDGETAVATVTVAGPLAVRTGTAPLGFSWNPWPEGEHTLCVEANAAGAIEESGRENNRSCATISVRAPTQACDLAVSLPSVTPQPGTAGSPLALTATVENVGTLDCPTTEVSFVEGPAGNIAQFVRVPLAALVPGASAVVSASLIAYSGTQGFDITADPDDAVRDGDRSNNSLAVESFTGDSNVPDLAVDAVSVAPAPAYPGEVVTVSAVVSNRGGLSPPTSVTFSIAGQTQVVPVDVLGSSETATVTARFFAPASSAAGLATVDGALAVAELSEGNNSRGFLLPVVSSGLSLAVSTSPSSAGPDAPIGVALSFANSGPARELAVSLELMRADGSIAQSILSAARVVAGVGASGATVAWNTARHVPVTYSLRATAFENGRFVAVAQTPFTVLPELATQARVAVDRGSYAPRETVVLTGRAVNASRNQALLGATVTTSFLDQAGAVLQSSVRPVPALSPLGHFELSDAHVLSPMAVAGAWRARLTFSDASGAVLATADAPFQVQVIAAQNVVTQTTVQPVFPAGPPLPVHVDLTNTSSAALTAADLRVELFDISGATLLAAESAASTPASVAPGATAGFDFVLPTAGIQPGPKLLVTRVEGAITERLRVEAVQVTDHEPPIITVTGVSDGLFSRVDLTPVVTITDASSFIASVTLDGQPFTSGTSVTTGGTHLLLVTATDFFGNSAFRQVRFTIDKTAPALTLTGVAPGAFSRFAVTLTYSATDSSPVTLTSTLNGVPFGSGDTVSAEGAYLWVVTATDAAGNTSTEQRSFTVDLTAPQVSITGVDEGAFENVAVQLDFTVMDSSPLTVVALLDGAPFSSGSTVSTEGPHTLTVTATDAAGNVGSASRSFTLDFTPPTISVTGLDASCGGARTITFSSNEGPASGTLDGLAFTSGATVQTEGAHVLVVSATDAAGNDATRTIPFDVDLTAPVISVSGVVDGQYYGAAVSIAFSASDAHLQTLSAVLDAAPFTSGSTVSTDGAHALVVTASDCAGNLATRSVGFTLDFTAPVVVISGVADGDTGASFTPSFSATDASPLTLTATLDGAAFSSGTAVTQLGAHTLVVTATDAAGNTTNRTVHFTVVSPGPADPPVRFAACGVSAVSVRNNAMSNGPVASSGSVLLANSALVLGDVVAGLDLTLQNSAQVTGAGRYGRNFNQGWSSSIQGGAAQVSPAPTPCTCSYDVAAQLALAATHNDNASVAQLLNGGGLTVVNSTVTLPAGTYHLSHLRVQHNGVLTGASGASVRLFVEGDVVIEQTASVGASGRSLLIVSGADSAAGGTVELRNSSQTYARLYAPKANVELGNHTRVTGAVVGRTLNLANHNVLTFDGAVSGAPLVCP